MSTGDVERARRLRRDQTPPEGVLWSRLRGRRLDGLKFRRQHTLGRFVADFYCAEALLVVEIDGRRHDRLRDDHRDRVLSDRGIQTLRFTASSLSTDFDGVLATIRRVARKRVAEAQGRS